MSKLPIMSSIAEDESLMQNLFIAEKSDNATLIALRAADILKIPERFLIKSKQQCYADIEQEIVRIKDDEIFVKNGILKDAQDKEIIDDEVLGAYADRLLAILSSALFRSISEDIAKKDTSFANASLVLSKINQADKKAILNKRSSEAGKSLAYIAVKRFEYNLLKLFLENGADPHFTDNDNDSLLHVLVRSTDKNNEGSPEVLLIAVLLLQAGIDRNALNIDEGKACDYIDRKKTLYKILNSTERELIDWREKLEKTLSRKEVFVQEDPVVSIGKDLVSRTYDEQEGIIPSTQTRLKFPPNVKEAYNPSPLRQVEGIEKS